MTNNKNNTPEISEILTKPYARMVIPDSDGTYFAEIVEFSGCFATGDSAANALENLEDVAVDWLAAAIAQDQDIPEPLDAAGYSGKLVLRMPKSLHQKAALYAERDGSSLNQFIVTCLAEHVGWRSPVRLKVAATMQTIYAPVLLLQPLFAPQGSVMGTLSSGSDYFRVREAALA
jgi:antitoxin HicB